MNKKTLFTLLSIVFLGVVLSGSAQAYTNMTTMNATNDYTYFNSYWNALNKIYMNPIGAFFGLATTAATQAAGVPADFLSLQIGNGNGNYTKQIGMDTVLFESQRTLYLKRITDMWDRYTILMYILKEVVTIIFYSAMIWLVLYVFFVAFPSIILKIRDSIISFSREAGK